MEAGNGYVETSDLTIFSHSHTDLCGSVFQGGSAHRRNEHPDARFHCNPRWNTCRIPGANTGHAGGCHAAEAGLRPSGRLFGSRTQRDAFERDGVGLCVALQQGGDRRQGKVELALLSDGVPVTMASGLIEGQGSLEIEVPAVEDGVYELEVEGPGFSASQQLQVESRTVLFLETDKPVYKPGQTVNIRALLLDPELKPVAGQVVVEAQDAKGIKIFRKTTTSDDYGMTTLELPLSTEPNLGVWKLTAFSGNRKTQLDIRVEEYVLPKYDVAVDLPKSWILANEPITGAVSSEYSYGRPVKGEVTITATRYVGRWEEYASVVEQLDGTMTFELPAPGYVAGVPGAGGLGNVQLQVTVHERNTGYVESTTQLITVAATPSAYR